MSVKVMGLVWESDLPRDEKFILLSYADHADHNGDSVFPSVTLISWKTGYSERQVQRITKKLIDKKILIEDGESMYGTNLYRVDLQKLPKREPFKMKKRGRPINGDILSSSENNGDILDENGDIQDNNGDIAMSPDPSFNRQESRQEEGATTSYLKIDALKILADSSGLVDFPNTYSEYKETVIRLAEQYGVEKTTNAMKNACNTWIKTKNKNGRNYFRTNLGWIDWAQESLLGGSLPKQNKQLSGAEKIELERQRILAEQE